MNRAREGGEGSARWRATLMLVAAGLVLAGCVTQSAGADPRELERLRASAVDGGRRHLCAIMIEGSLECWGANSFGQTGDGNPSQQATRPRPVPSLPAVSAVSAGADFTCALDDDGAPWCWGQNMSGQLGNGARITLSLTPEPVLGEVVATDVAAGDFHACALEAGGAVSCWGLGAHGQIGDGASEDRYRPRRANVSGATALTAGANHVCAVVAAGGVRCWGLNRFGQLGDGSQNDSSTPKRVAGIDGVAVEVVAGDDFSCARLEDGRVQCWGANGFGQLGDGRRTNRPSASEVVGIRSAVDVVAGGRHACAALEDGEVRCWGANESGQLGGGGTTHRSVPVLATVGNGARQVSATDTGSCSTDAGGRLACWGFGR